MGLYHCILWSNLVFSPANPSGLGVICYTDDTLVKARGPNFQDSVWPPGLSFLWLGGVLVRPPAPPSWSTQLNILCCNVKKKAVIHVLPKFHFNPVVVTYLQGSPNGIKEHQALLYLSVSLGTMISCSPGLSNQDKLSSDSRYTLICGSNNNLSLAKNILCMFPIVWSNRPELCAKAMTWSICKNNAFFSESFLL